MDIKEINNGAISISRFIQDKKKENTPADFQKTLQEARTGKLSVDPSTSTSPGSKNQEILLDPAFNLNSIELSLPAKEPLPAQSQGIQAAESTLNLLEEYQKAMGNPNRTLKEIDPLVQALMEKINANQEIAQKLAPTDPLRRILREIEILSAVETQKFNRGDYV